MAMYISSIPVLQCKTKHGGEGFFFFKNSQYTTSMYIRPRKYSPLQELLFISVPRSLSIHSIYSSTMVWWDGVDRLVQALPTTRNSLQETVCPARPSLLTTYSTRGALRAKTGTTCTGCISLWRNSVQRRRTITSRVSSEK